MKTTVNRAVRAGLGAPQSAPQRGKYVLKPRALGFRGENLPARVLAALEESEVLRKLGGAK